MIAHLSLLLLAGAGGCDKLAPPQASVPGASWNGVYVLDREASDDLGEVAKRAAGQLPRRARGRAEGRLRERLKAHECLRLSDDGAVVTLESERGVLWRASRDGDETNAAVSDSLITITRAGERGEGRQELRRKDGGTSLELAVKVTSRRLEKPIAYMLIYRARGGAGSSQGARSAEATLERQLAEVRRATERYRDVEVARRDGYVLMRAAMDAPLLGEHWVHQERMDQPVDLARPAVLQYTNVGDQRVLVGVTYGHMQRPGDPLPEGFAGSGDQWHVHDMPELMAQLTRHRPWYVRLAAERRLDALGVSGGGGRPTLAMLHVWLWVENPDGIFANYNPALPYLRAGLPVSWARAGDYAAARGVELMAEGACDRMIDRTSRLVGADRAQRGEVRKAREAAAEQVIRARRDGPGSDSLNVIAARAWRDLAAGASAVLTPAQRQELASFRGGMTAGQPHQPGGHAH